MKKILLAFIVALISIALFGCDQSAEIGTYEFENKTTQTLAEVQEKLLFYQEKIETFYIFEGPYDDSSSFVKDDLNVKTNQYLALGETSLFLDIVEKLISYKTALETCDAFEENVFCFTQDTRSKESIKVKMENDQVFIESYQYLPAIVNSNVPEEKRIYMIYLNFIEDKVYFDYIVDINIESEMMDSNYFFYNSFYESNKQVGLTLNQNNHFVYSYEEQDAISKKSFHISSGLLSKVVGYYDQSASMFSMIRINDDNEIMQNIIEYTMPTSNLIYSEGAAFATIPSADINDISIQWNLKEVSGWDRIDLAITKNTLIKDDDPIISDLQLNVMKDGSKVAYLTAILEKEALTTDVLDLSKYGLLFDAVSLEKLIVDRTYLEGNYTDVLDEYGFSSNFDTHYNALVEMLPFEPDLTVAQDIFSTLESQD